MAEKIDPRVEKVTNAFSLSLDYFKFSRIESEKNMNYLLGNQWSPREKELAREHNYPCETLNIIASRCNVISGNSSVSQMIPVVKAFNVDYQTKADEQNSVIEIVWEDNKIEYKMSQLFGEALWSKMGAYIRCELQINNDMLLDFVFTILDSCCVHPDPQYKDPGLEDCRWVVIESWMRREEIEQKYGTNLEMSNNSPWYTQIRDFIGSSLGWNTVDCSGICSNQTSSSISVSTGYGNNWWYDKKEDRWLVLEMLENTKKYYDVALTEDGIDIAGGDNTYRRQKPICKQTIIVPGAGNKVVLERDIEYHGNWCGIFNVSSMRNSVPAYMQTCLVSQLISAQNIVNKNISAIMYKTANMLAPVLIVNPNEERLAQDLREQGANGGVFSAEFDNATAVVPLVTPDIPVSHFSAVDTAISIADNIAQVNDAMQGNIKSATSGTLLESAYNIASQATKKYFEDMKRVREQMAKHIVDNLPYVYFENSRILRIKDNSGEYGFRLLSKSKEDMDAVNGIMFDEIPGGISIEEDVRSPLYRDRKANMIASVVQFLSSVPAFNSAVGAQLTVMRLLANTIGGKEGEQLVKSIDASSDSAMTNVHANQQADLMAKMAAVSATNAQSQIGNNTKTG